MRAYLLVIPVAVLASAMAFSEEDTIPDWIRAAAGWWSEGTVSDAEYISAIRWLVDNGYIPVENKNIVREGYGVSYPYGWERQIPERGENGIIDSIVAHQTLELDVPARISVSTHTMMGNTMEEHREWGLELINQILGDAFNHTHSEMYTVAGKSGYMDEYLVKIFGLTIQGKSYSVAHEGIIYEVKYETEMKHFDMYLDVFESVATSLQLE